MTEAVADQHRADALPGYNDFVPAWVERALETECWDIEHGSSVWRLIEDIAGGSVRGFDLPEEVRSKDLSEVDLTDPEIAALIRSWAVHRHAYVLRGIPSTGGPLRLGRTMRVQEGWVDEVLAGTGTLGVFFGELPLDDGSFWIDDDQPVDIYMEVEVSPEDIDWEGTILTRMDYLMGDDEREIRLRPGVRAKVIVLDVDGDKDDRLIGLSVNVGERWPRKEKSADADLGTMSTFG